MVDLGPLKGPTFYNGFAGQVKKANFAIKRYLILFLEPLNRRYRISYQCLLPLHFLAFFIEVMLTSLSTSNWGNANTGVGEKKWPFSSDPPFRLSGPNPLF